MRVLDESLRGLLIGEVCIDVADVLSSFELGLVGRDCLALGEVIPVDRLEEGVSHDLLDAEAVLWVSLKESCEQISRPRRKAWQDFDVLLGDAAENLVA